MGTKAAGSSFRMARETSTRIGGSAASTPFWRSTRRTGLLTRRRRRSRQLFPGCDHADGVIAAQLRRSVRVVVEPVRAVSYARVEEVLPEQIRRNARDPLRAIVNLDSNRVVGATLVPGPSG